MAEKAGISVDLRSKELLSFGVCDIIRDRLKSNDKTLTRIDRRVGIDKYNDKRGPDRSEFVDRFHEASWYYLKLFRKLVKS